MFCTLLSHGKTSLLGLLVSYNVLLFTCRNDFNMGDPRLEARSRCPIILQPRRSIRQVTTSTLTAVTRFHHCYPIGIYMSGPTTIWKRQYTLPCGSMWMENVILHCSNHRCKDHQQGVRRQGTNWQKERFRLEVVQYAWLVEPLHLKQIYSWLMGFIFQLFDTMKPQTVWKHHQDAFHL